MRPIVTTRSGRHLNVLDPSANDIDINDIAHALSNTARFGGHTRDFYSVAQHSVLASRAVRHSDALAALLHDAAEAYVGDLVTPLKVMMPEFQLIEDRLLAVILHKFGLAQTLPPDVLHIDRTLLATEQRDLLENHDDWGLPAALPQKLIAVPPAAAKEMFLRRFWELYASGPHTVLPVAGCVHTWVAFRSEGKKECQRCGAKEDI